MVGFAKSHAFTPAHLLQKFTANIVTADAIFGGLFIRLSCNRRRQSTTFSWLWRVRGAILLPPLFRSVPVLQDSETLPNRHTPYKNSSNNSYYKDLLCYQSLVDMFKVLLTKPPGDLPEFALVFRNSSIFFCKNMSHKIIYVEVKLSLQKENLDKNTQISY